MTSEHDFILRKFGSVERFDEWKAQQDEVSAQRRAAVEAFFERTGINNERWRQ